MASPNGRHSRKSAADRAIEAAKALELRRDGHSVADIATALAISRPTASRRLSEAVREMMAESAADYRAVAEARLDMLTREWADKYEAAIGNFDQQARCLNGLLAVEKARMRLLGYAIPSRTILELEGSD